MRQKMSNQDRAKQFLPFNGLRGYYDLINKANKEIVDRRELSEDELANLSKEFLKIRKKSIIRIVYYNDGGYITKEGMVSSFDVVNRVLKIVKEEIFFDDILKLEVL